MIIVADTSPLNYLVLIQSIDILPALYGRVIIPPEVLAELLHAQTPPAVREWATAHPAWLEVKVAQNIDHSLPLDDGEKAAIALAKEMNAQRLLIDETDGREIATRLGIPIAGTLAVLRDAALSQLLDLKQAFERLNATSFRASPKLLEQVLRDFEKRKR